MSTKHEPGPWILGGCSGRMITTPSGYVGDGFIADVDTLANAKLIAAAPDMLDVLSELTEGMEGVFAIAHGATVAIKVETIIKALEIIKKATS